MKAFKIIAVIVVIGLLGYLAKGLFFKTADPGNSGRIKITILGENSANIQSLMSLEKEYESAHPNVDLVFQPKTFDEAFEKANHDFQNKTGLYDVVMQYNFSLSPFVRNHYVYRIDELSKDIPSIQLNFENDIFQNTWKSVGYFYKNPDKPEEGISKVGYPFAANSMLLIYNKKMFEDSSNRKSYFATYHKDLTIPSTWEDFYNIAKFFTNSSAGTKGICMEGSAGGYLYYEFLNYLVSMGGKVLDKDLGWQGDSSTKVTLESPGSVKALDYFVSLKPFDAGNFSDVEQFKKLEIMKEGKTAMAIAWDDIIVSTLMKDGKFDDRFGFSVIPGSKSFIGGGSFFISKQTKHPKEALDFILYIMQPSTQVKLARHGLSSPLQSTYDDSIVRSYPHSQALRQSLQRGGIYPEAGPDSKMIDDVLTTYVQKTWNGEVTPQQAIEAAQKEIKIKRTALFKNLGTAQ